MAGDRWPFTLLWYVWLLTARFVAWAIVWIYELVAGRRSG
jgi:hypothetical protein